MKALIIIILLATTVTYGQTDRYFESAQLLKSYFSHAESPDSLKYQKLFFEEFPDNFKDFNEIFGYYTQNEGDSINEKLISEPGPLYDGYQYITYFFSLTSIPTHKFYLKIINVALGGHWEADAVNYFQQGYVKRFFKILNSLLIY